MVQLDVYYAIDCAEHEDLTFCSEGVYASFPSYEEVYAAATANLAPVGTSVFFCCFKDEGELMMEVYYDLAAAYAYLPRTGGVAAVLAATAGLSRESLPASETPPDSASTKPRADGQSLVDCDWGLPCYHYRGAAYVAAWFTLFVLSLFKVWESVVFTCVYLLHAFLLPSLPWSATAGQQREVWVNSYTDDSDAEPPKLHIFAVGRCSGLVA
jgi:hypothetical protein